MKMKNNQQPTCNIEQPMIAAARSGWMLDVGCSVFDVPQF
jgi:hypothetical protein